MDRRSFIGIVGGSILAAPLVAKGQNATKLRHIGFLAAGATPAHRRQLDSLLQGLRELGYVQGKTIVITALWPKSLNELPELAASLVKQDVEVIVAPSSAAVEPLSRVTQTIPIVFATAADPVGSGFVANLSHPGGDITGLSLLNIELSGKRVELLHEILGPARPSCCGFYRTIRPRLRH
jgi:putative ABC transport system substrate-binding protein